MSNMFNKAIVLGLLAISPVVFAVDTTTPAASTVQQEVTPEAKKTVSEKKVKAKKAHKKVKKTHKAKKAKANKGAAKETKKEVKTETAVEVSK
ncbi:MAG: hypothetical protein LEGION0398_MBIBDBAK_01090 [Legionellaceae bacterium]